MTEQFQSILRKLQNSAEPQTQSHLYTLSFLLSQSKRILQFKFSMQIVNTLNQILASTHIPCSKITILKILTSIVDKCKSVTPRALYELDLIVKLLTEGNKQIIKEAQLFLLKYTRSYMRIDDVFLGYIQAKQSNPQIENMEQAIISSFQSLVREQPKCITYCEDNQLLINFIKQLLAYIENDLYVQVCQRTLYQLVNSECFQSVYKTFSKRLMETLKKYFLDHQQLQRQKISRQLPDENQFQANQKDDNESNQEQQESCLLDDFQNYERKTKNLFLNTLSKIENSNKNTKQTQSKKPTQKYAEFLNVSNKQNIEQSQYKYLDTSILDHQHNPNQSSLFGSAISLFNQQQSSLKPSQYKQLNIKSNIHSRVTSPICSIINSQEQIQVVQQPIDYKLQSQLQQIINNLEKDLTWSKKCHYLSQMRYLMKNNQFQYLPEETQNVLIDICYDHKLNNCMLAFWGLQHLSELYFSHLKHIQDIQSTCLMKLSDININIRNASRKVLFTFGVKRTLIVVQKLFQKYSTCSYYRKRQVLQLIAELATIMGQSDAIVTVEYISQHIIDAAPDEYRAFLKILYFQNERFGSSFRKYINKYLKENELGKYNQMSRPSQILLVAEDEKEDIRAVINIDDDGEVINTSNTNNVEEENLDSFNVDLTIPNFNNESSFKSKESYNQYSQDDQVCSEECTTDRNEMDTELQIPRSLKKSVSAFLSIPRNISAFQQNKSKNISGRRKSDNDQISFLKPISLINQRRKSKKIVNVVYVRKQDLVLPPTPKQIFNSLASRMKDNTNWRNQYESLNDLRALFHLDDQYKQKIIENFTLYIAQIIKMVNAQRSSLAKTAIITIQQFCEFCYRQMQPHLQSLIGSLLKKSLSIHDFIVDEINRCFTFIVEYCSSTKIISVLYNLFLSKNIQIQSQIVYCLELIVIKLDLSNLVMKQPKSLIMLQYFSSNQNQRIKSGFTRIVKTINSKTHLQDIQYKLRSKHFYNLVDKIQSVYTDINK